MKNGDQFKEDVFNQLTAQIYKSNQPLTISTFSEVWLQAENKLKININRMKGEIEYAEE